MSAVAWSAAAFAVYLFGMGVALLAVPGTFQDLLDLPPADDLYLRLVGAIAIALGIYYAAAARDENLPFLRSTVPARTWVFIAFTVTALVAREPILIAFGIVDLAFAAWTRSALRASDRHHVGLTTRAGM